MNKNISAFSFARRFLSIGAFLLLVAPAALLSAQAVEDSTVYFSRGARVAASEKSGQAAALISQTVVISQIYGGAGCGTAGCSTYKNDYIEIFNRGAQPQSLSGWSIQYAAASGTAWIVTPLTNVTLQPGQYYLIAQGAGTNGVSNIPVPDASGTVAMSATSAKVALVNSTTALSGACPTAPTIVDLVGYGASATCNEGGANAPAPSTTTADFRAANGCADTDVNSFDFRASTPVARNTSSPLITCFTTAAPTTVAGRVLSGKQRPVASAVVTLTDSSGEIRMTRTNSFGYYRFTGVASGGIYVLGAKHKSYHFAPAVLDLSDDLGEVNLTAIEP